MRWMEELESLGYSESIELESLHKLPPGEPYVGTSAGGLHESHHRLWIIHQILVAGLDVGSQ